MSEIIQRSFTSGEISPSVQARANIVKYLTGLNLCENFIVKAEGGVYSRPGLEYKAEQNNSAKKGRLIPFSFNTTQTYILLFENLTVKIIENGVFVETAPGSGTDLVVTTPYTEAELPFLGYTQNADVMTITHPNHDPRNFNRTGANSFTLTLIDFAPTVTPPVFNAGVEGPFDIVDVNTRNPTRIRTSPAHGWQTGNLIDLSGFTTADLGGALTQEQVDILNTSHVITVISDTAFDLVGVNIDTGGFDFNPATATASKNLGANSAGAGAGSFNKTYAYVVTAVDADGVESLPSVATSVTIKSLSETFGVRLDWDVVAAADYYRVYKDPSVGSGIYGWVGDSKNTTFDDYNIAPLQSDAPPSDRQPFSGADDKPSTVEYYQQRLVFANTTNEPQAVYTTQTGNFKSMRVSDPTRDDDAVTFAIAAKQVNEVRHLLSLDSLILMTSGGEWIVTEGQDRVLTPSTIGVRIQSYNGASWVKPAVINSTALYVQEKGTKIRDLSYEFSSDKYTGSDLSIMARHLFRGKTITEMVYADEPYGILWCVRSDGVLLGLTYEREHQVWGWHQHVTDGAVESVAVISEDGRDAVYVIVNRTIGGQTKRYVERLAAREETNAEDCFYVDSGITYDSTPTTTISGLSHLEGETVVALADGNVVKDLVVDTGAVTLPVAASKVHVGLPYTPAIETLDIDINSDGETIKADYISVSRVVLEVQDTRGGWVGPRTDADSNRSTTMLEIAPRFDFDSYDTIALKTYKQEILIDNQWSRGGGIRIEQRDPLPMSILSVIPRVDVSVS